MLNISEGGVTSMTRERWRRPVGTLPKTQRAEEKDGRDEESSVEGELIVDLKGVGVKYGNRTVSKFSSAHFLSFLCLFSQDFSPFFPVFHLFTPFLFFLRARVPFRVFSFLSFVFASLLKFSSHSWRTSSFLQFPFRFPEHPLLIQVLTMR